MASSNDDKALRPRTLRDFKGQPKICELLSTYIKAAKAQGKALDHILLYGQAGLGKTTLAGVVAAELNVPFVSVSATGFKSLLELQLTLAKLEKFSVLFIDEIHSLPTKLAEVLYSSMEDFEFATVLHKIPRIVSLNPFTLIGATTNPEKLTIPMRDRFGIQFAMEPYSIEGMLPVLARCEKLLDLKFTPEALFEVAKRCRGVPRIATTFMRRIRDFALIQSPSIIDDTYVSKTLDTIGVDKNGLNSTDMKYLISLLNNFDGGPVGLESIASLIRESTTTVNEVVEPYLLRCGYIQRTGSGRVLLPKGAKLVKESGHDVC